MVDAMHLEAALYCVATPIGNLGDITERAVAVLRAVDVIYAEDTRVTRKLLTHLSIRKTLHSLHEHNEAGRVEEITALIEAGQRIALVSDAGTPLISDPGYRLVNHLTARGIKAIPIPGVSALITALSAAGLPTDRFTFEGFLPAKPGLRRKALQALKTEPRTVVLYESSHRIGALLADMEAILGPERPLVIARELTKLYETFYRGSATSLLAQLQTDTQMRKGEFVVMIAGVQPQDEAGGPAQLEVSRLLETLVAELPVRQAAQIAARLTGLAKNDLYRQAMAISRSLRD